MKCSENFILALEEEYDRSFDEYMSGIESEQEHTFSEKHEKKMKKLIKRQSKPYFKFISTASRRAACIIVAIMVFSASALSVNAGRDRLKKFFITEYEGYRIVEVVDKSGEGYPKTIEKEYRISNIPEGFDLIDINKSITSVHRVYKRDNDYIVVSQYTKENYEMNLDNEHTTLETITDSDGTEYLIATSTYGQIMYLWDSGEYIFDLSSTLGKDATMELCRSLKVKE